MLKFYLISWCCNFLEKRRFHTKKLGEILVFYVVKGLVFQPVLIPTILLFFILGCLVVPPHNTKLYERNSVNVSAVYTCNYLQKLNETFFINHHKESLRSLTKKYF